MVTPFSSLSVSPKTSYLSGIDRPPCLSRRTINYPRCCRFVARSFVQRGHSFPVDAGCLACHRIRPSDNRSRFVPTTLCISSLRQSHHPKAKPAALIWPARRVMIDEPVVPACDGICIAPRAIPDDLVVQRVSGVRGGDIAHHGHSVRGDCQVRAQADDYCRWLSLVRSLPAGEEKNKQRNCK